MNPAENLTRGQRELRVKMRARWLGLEVGNVDQRTFIVTKWNHPGFRFPVMGSATLDEIEEALRRLEQ